MSMTFKSMCFAVAFGLVCGPVLAADDGLTPKQRYAEAMALQSSAPTEMIAGLEALATEGYARAMDRLGYFSLKGIGTEQNTDRAIAYYQQAIDAERSASFVSLGKVYLTIGEHQKALDALDAAVGHGHEKAEAVLAWAHATGRLGDLSQGEQGFADLVTLAQADIRDAQMYLLDAAARRTRTPDNIDYVLDRLHARHADGDAKAAEALLRYYRMQGHARGTLQARQTLLDTDGLRDKIRVEEGLYLAVETEPHRFWRRSEELVQTAPADVYGRALSVTARINRNAYVRIVQKELRRHGYAVGRPSPYMNQPLIRAINRFCRENDLNDTCRYGPLKSVTIKAVASKLAEMRDKT